MRIYPILSAVVILLTSTLSSNATPAKIPYEDDSRQRVENGFVLLWKGHFAERNQQIEVYSLDGKQITSFGVLGIVPDATRVSLWDVAASRDRIAVAAVFAKASSVQSMLLLFDMQGKLQSAFALPPSRGIEMLDFDDQSNLWTVTLSQGDKDAAAVPMIVEYDASGRQLRTFLTRDLFPPHSKTVQINAKSGHPNGGFDSGMFWFWLPVSNDLVTVQTATGELHRYSTGWPALEARAFPFTMFKASGTRFLLDTRDPSARESGNGASTRFYSWSPGEDWTALPARQGCFENGVVLGFHEGAPVLVDPASHEICTEDFAFLR